MTGTSFNRGYQLSLPGQPKSSWLLNQISQRWLPWDHLDWGQFDENLHMEKWYFVCSVEFYLALQLQIALILDVLSLRMMIFLHWWILQQWCLWLRSGGSWPRFISSLLSRPQLLSSLLFSLSSSSSLLYGGSLFSRLLGGILYTYWWKWPTWINFSILFFKVIHSSVVCP